jgi:NADPH:quinone reductase-like Zn-dependent oxidoreductase
MKAIVQDSYGSADVLELRDIGTPAIAAGEVLVRVHAAGVDRGVWHLMTGLPYPVRLAGYGLRAPKTKADLVRSLGADHVIDYTRADFAEGKQRYDVILDIGGNPSLSRLRQALAPKGTLVIAGGETGGRWLGGTDRQLRALLLSRFVDQKLTTFICRENHEDLIVLKELIESGKVTPAIDRTYPLYDAPKAIRYLEQGHPGGKVVITV